MTGGTILGCLEDFSYQSKRLTLNPGDMLFLYTDGINEAFNASDEQFGDDRLEQYLAGSYEKSPEEAVKGCIDAVTDFAGDVAQSDDMTLLAIRYNGRP